MLYINIRQLGLVGMGDMNIVVRRTVTMQRPRGKQIN
jgi:hypothetical protein